jgi:hypothetical protein
VFEITGLHERMGITTTTPSGEVIPNSYTLLAEADSIFNKKGIFFN